MPADGSVLSAQPTLPAIQQPTGPDPHRLYLWAQSATDALRRLSNSSTNTIDPAALQAAIDGLNDATAEAEALIAQIQADITSLSVAGLTSQQLFLLQRFAAGRELLGTGLAIANETMRWAQTVGEAGLRNLVELEETKNGIRVFQRVIHTETLGLAEQIEIVQADLGATNAAIVAETTARVNGDNANASAITTVSTAVGGLTSQVTTIQESVDGIEAYYGILIQAGNRTGFFKLDGTAAEINAIFGVDKFIIMHPTSTGITAAPFVVGLVNGVSTVAINGQLVVDGTILARHIAAASITAEKINVATLSAIVANLGTINAGLVQDAAGTYFFDFTNGKFGRTDGKILYDLANSLHYMDA